MIFDKTLLFSDRQAITADAASTDIIDLGATGTVYGAAAALTRDVGKGNRLPINIQVVETFNTLTSLTFSVQVDTVENFGSPKTVASQTIPLAELTAGKVSSLNFILPGADERYLRVHYDVNGTNPTLGRVTAGIVAAMQTNGVDF